MAVEVGGAKAKDDDKLMAMAKSMKLSESEMKFLKKYRTLEDLEREKGIKFFECVGDPPATDQFIENVNVMRQNFITNKQDSMRARDLDRFAAEVNQDFVVVPVVNEMVSGPKWDVYENNHFAMRKRLVTIFLKVANKLIIRMRAGKRLK